ncbi:MAG: c-type cytochrome [Ekhidna sp.]|nr:c-type cytochrome [Ekhidna sp.]
MYRIVITLSLLLIFQCQPKEASNKFSFEKNEKQSSRKVSMLVDLKNKGIGPVSSVVLEEAIDSVLVRRGRLMYQEKCMVCHKIGSKFIGPPPNGILKRRTPEWVMNMILNTDEMLQKDSLAKALFMEFDGQLMTNQNLNEEESRAIVEYFRVLE